MAVKVTLAAASIALVLLTLEAAARIAYYRRPGGKQGERAAYVSPDPVLGWRKRPGARATYRRREYSVEVVINGRGLRDVERQYEKPRGTFRVLAVGDSMVEAYTVPLADSVSQVTERELDRGPGCRAEVINGGTSGYSTDQEYLFYREEGRRYSPDVVLLFFFYNDIVFNTKARYWGAPKPVLASRGARLEVSNYPVPSPYPGPPEAPRPQEQVRGSAALQWLKERLARGAPRLHNRLAGFGLWDPIGGATLEQDDEIRVYKRRRQPPIEAAWGSTAAILREFAAAARAAGQQFAVVYVPSRFEVNDRDWELTRMMFGLEEAVWDRGLVMERLTAIGAESGFDVLDLTPAMRAADRGLLGRPYYVYDGHWNARGHRIAGQAVAVYLRTRGWLPDCIARDHDASR